MNSEGNESNQKEFSRSICRKGGLKVPLSIVVSDSGRLTEVDEFSEKCESAVNNRLHTLKVRNSRSRAGLEPQNGFRNTQGGCFDQSARNFGSKW